MVLQVSLAFIVIGWVLLEEGHIKVVVVTDRLSEKLRNWVIMVTSFASVFGCGYLTYLVWLSAARSIKIVEMGEEIAVPIYPFKVLMFIGFFLVNLQFIARGYKHYQLLRSGKEST